jgi:hypothetical protein
LAEADLDRPGLGAAACTKPIRRRGRVLPTRRMVTRRGASLQDAVSTAIGARCAWPVARSARSRLRMQ